MESPSTPEYERVIINVAPQRHNIHDIHNTNVFERNIQPINLNNIFNDTVYECRV
jgi:hypothetical protein